MPRPRMTLRYGFLFVAVLMATVPARAQQAPFSWEGATVYQIVTDRFSNGNSDNNGAYGRGLDGNGTPYAVDSTGHFLGGDWAGIRGWIEDGWFAQLGVDALWISAPYEQVHGWISERGGDYQHYGYHGYWALDYTEPERSFGDREAFRALVDTAHANGIRIVMDVVMNHPGRATLHDMVEFGFGGVTDNAWRSWRPSDGIWSTWEERFVTYADSAEAWTRWWGPGWIRSDVTGYEACGEEDMTLCLFELPDFRTESRTDVDIPPFLQLKWGEEKRAAERAELDAWFAARGYPRSPGHYLVKWLTDWVREFGVDGFRFDTIKHVDLDMIQTLKTEATHALEDWRAENPGQSPDNLPFWMVGEDWGHGVERSVYFDYGLDAMINFDFVTDLDADLDSVYTAYAAARATSSVLTYVSSHDTELFDRSRLMDAGTRLLLLPGAVNIFYGDETARPPGPAVSDPSQPTRSFMNWGTPDEKVLAHWRTLGAFRKAHPAVARGTHMRLSAEPYAFHRRLDWGRDGRDDVVVVLGASNERVRLNVSRVWPDDTALRDASTGKVAIVSYGQVTFTAGPSGILLLEEIR